MKGVILSHPSTVKRAGCSIFCPPLSGLSSVDQALVCMYNVITHWLDYDAFQSCNIFCPPLSGLSCTWPSTLLLSFLNSLNPWTLHEIHTLRNAYSPVQTKFCTLVCIMQNGDYSLQDAQCILAAAHKANCKMGALQNGFTLEAAFQQRQTSA